MTSYEANGKSLDEAIRAGLSAMGVERDAVSVEVLEKPKSGFFGLGGTPARVRLTLVDTPSLLPRPAVKKEAPAPAAPAKTAPVKSAPVQQKPAAAQQAAQPSEKKPFSAPRNDNQQRGFANKQRHHEHPAPAAAKQPAEPRNSAPAVKSGNDGGRLKQGRPTYPASPAQEKAALEFINGLMVQMKTGAEATSKIDGEGVIHINITGENLGGLIGRRGDTLDAIQHLTAHVINSDPDKLCRVHVDAADYRAKRQDALERLAKRMAENSMKYRNNMVLEPMNAYERHIIHMALQDVAGVTTYSQGVEPQRRVVIAFQGSGRQSRGGFQQNSGRSRRNENRGHGGARRSEGRFRDDRERPRQHAAQDSPRVSAPQPAAPAAPQPAAPQPSSAQPSAVAPRGLPVKEFGVKRKD